MYNLKELPREPTHPPWKGGINCIDKFRGSSFLLGAPTPPFWRAPSHTSRNAQTHAHTEILKCNKLMSLRLRVPEQSLKHSRHKGPLLPAAHARRYFAYLDFFVWDYFLVLNNLQNVRKCKAENREITGFPYLVMDLSFAVSTRMEGGGGGGQFGSKPVFKASFITAL